MTNGDSSKKGKASRDKGKRRELELVHLLNHFGFGKVRRGYVFHNEPDIVGLDGFHVEVKGVERLNVLKALNQSITDSQKRKDGIPTLWWKTSRQPWTVTLLAEDFIKLIGGIENDVNGDDRDTSG